MRRYGQHFLKDPQIIERIMEASGVSAADAVLEIGPGQGVLTRALAGRVKKILAVEIDRRLFAGLSEAGLPSNVETRLGDILAVKNADISATLGGSYHLVANLPYEITSATLKKFLTESPKPESITMMIQKEAGERIIAKDGKENRLSLFCRYHAEAKLMFMVPAGAFSPPPKVTSCVIRLVPRPKPLLVRPDENRLFNLIKAGFANPRKSLKNTLGIIFGKNTENALVSAKIVPTSRPETVSLEQWMTLASQVW
jgi:16S rRNA (adenine1518-N6/adenine1519-N6)-dimethyltransferase